MGALRRIRLGVLVATVAGGISAAGAAQAQAKLVVSDGIGFKGTVNAAGEFSSTKCALKSDGETGALPCGVGGTASGIGTPSITLSSIWAGPDGEGLIPTFGMPRIASKPPIETYGGTGQCRESEESDLPGTKGPVQYPCVVTVRLVFNTAKGTVSGRYLVREESTQP